MGEAHDAERFLGMTKFQFLGAMMVVVCALFAGTVFNLTYAVRENKERLAQIQGNQAELARLATRAEQDHTGLCAFIIDLEKRASYTAALLDETSPDPFIFGIPRATLENSLKGQQATLRALNGVNCEE